MQERLMGKRCHIREGQVASRSRGGVQHDGDASQEEGCEERHGKEEIRSSGGTTE